MRARIRSNEERAHFKCDKRESHSYHNWDQAASGAVREEESREGVGRGLSLMTVAALAFLFPGAGANRLQIGRAHV